MKDIAYNYIYGPVSSWRLGSSLGIDPLSCGKKVCSFDCLYCQLGKTEGRSIERKKYVGVEQIIDEIDLLPSVTIDYITFSGTGEPTLASNLGQMIQAIKKVRKEKIAVITNSSLLTRVDVQNDLLSADTVVAKLDASSEHIFRTVNRPHQNITFDAIVSALKLFKHRYHGTLALQIMFMKENENSAQAIAGYAREINPDEIEINTPLRPCGVTPLSEPEIEHIQKYFTGLNTRSVYSAPRKKVKAFSAQDTLTRRGKG